MKVAILQPSYIPWPGYFFWIQNCDFFVFLDDVQYTKHDWRNRNKIKSANGVVLLTVPVLTKGKYAQTILEAKIDNKSDHSCKFDWRKKHWTSIQQHYNKAPYFKKYEEFLREVYEKDWDYLVDLNIYLMMEISRIIGLNASFVRSSELDVSGKKTERLVNICKNLEATEYMAGERSKTYLQEELFYNENIVVTYRDYKPVAYPQLYGEFVPYLSILDMLLNCGEESTQCLHL